MEISSLPPAKKKTWLRLVVAVIAVLLVVGIVLISGLLPKSRPGQEEQTFEKLPANTCPEKVVDETVGGQQYAFGVLEGEKLLLEEGGWEWIERNCPGVKREEGGQTAVTFYPNTKDAPTLKLTWKGKLDPKNVTRVTPYGMWEDWKKYSGGTAYEPAWEMQFYTETFNESYLAVAAGIITGVDRFEDGSGMVNIRYGEYYGVSYMHIIPAKDLEVGQKIKAGDPLGKTQKKCRPDDGVCEGWWEIALTRYKDGVFRSVPPYSYFDAKSKSKLDAILDAIPYWGVIGSPRTWTVTTGCSWVKYTKAPEWWSNSGRLGYTPEGAKEETEEEFIKAINSKWKVGDKEGRIIGPTDKCK